MALVCVNLNEMIYTSHVSILSTVSIRRSRILNMSITKSVSQPNTYTAYQLLITTIIVMKTTKGES